MFSFYSLLSTLYLPGGLNLPYPYQKLCVSVSKCDILRGSNRCTSELSYNLRWNDLFPTPMVQNQHAWPQ